MVFDYRSQVVKSSVILATEFLAGDTEEQPTELAGVPEVRLSISLP